MIKPLAAPWLSNVAYGHLTLAFVVISLNPTLDNIGFTFDASTIWNELSDDVHSASSVASLREKLESHLFSPRPLHHCFWFSWCLC